MHWAVANNDMDMLLLLESYGGKLDIPDRDGLTPLYYAVELPTAGMT